MCRGIYFPTLYLNVIRCGGDKVMAGLTVASMSLGRIVISPYFGMLSETIRHRKVLLISTTILAVGAMIYSQAQQTYMLVLGQFIVGIGSGTLGVTRSYVAETTEPKNRTESMAYLTAMQYTGFAVFPIIGAMLVSLGDAVEGTHILGLSIFPINQFTLPAFFTIAAALGMNMCLLFLFKDYEVTPAMMAAKYEKEVEEKNKRRAQADLELQMGPAGVEVCTDPEACDDPPKTLYGFAIVPLQRILSRVTHMSLADKLAIGGCILNTTTKGTIGIYETLGVSIAKADLGWDNVKAGVFFACAGAGGVAALMSFRWLVSSFGDVKLTVWGLGIMVMSLALLVDWTGAGVSKYAFLAAVPLMYTIGYPIGHTAELGMFSKISSKGPQGQMQGWFGSAGSLGRILYPILAGVLAQYVGESAIFIVAAVGIVLSIISVLAFETEITSIITS